MSTAERYPLGCVCVCCYSLLFMSDSPISTRCKEMGEGEREADALLRDFRRKVFHKRLTNHKKVWMK
ncbi:MAG: hypothetical protein WA667_02140 [Candidatus Nitrosopolaris sp.]